MGSAMNNSNATNYPGSTSSANAIGLDIQSGLFYFFQNNSSGSQIFVSYNASTKTYQTLATSPISISVVKGCVTADGKGYYCIDAAGMLCYYNIASNKWTKIGSNLVDQFNNNLATVFSNLGSGDIAIDGTGNLWIVVSSATQWGLYELAAPLPITATSTITLHQLIPPTQPTPGGSPFGGIAYNSTGQIYMSTVNDLYILSSNFTLSHIGTFSSGGVGADLTSCNYPLSVLATDWSNFSAKIQSANAVQLNWSFNQSTETKGYFIQRSGDAMSWLNIDYKAGIAKEGAINYSFIDDATLPGINYYRIQMINSDGSLSYSTIRAINFLSKGNIRVWPVPARNVLHIDLQKSNNLEFTEVKIFTPSGALVLSQVSQLNGNGIDVSKLPIGLYFLHLSLANGTSYSEKFERL
ncbi:MAG: T9SS type A sorting domain-containing protein [Bacteroidota bacterium]|nr:T9SS type A sorting domain-containing protein [Bacteroidota bacterium]